MFKKSSNKGNRKVMVKRFGAAATVLIVSLMILTLVLIVIGGYTALTK